MDWGSEAGMEKSAKIYIAGHRGMVGSAIHRTLQGRGYSNFVSKTHGELDLTNQRAVEEFFFAGAPGICFPGSGEGGRDCSEHGRPSGIFAREFADTVQCD